MSPTTTTSTSPSNAIIPMQLEHNQPSNNVFKYQNESHVTFSYPSSSSSLIQDFPVGGSNNEIISPSATNITMNNDQYLVDQPNYTSSLFNNKIDSNSALTSEYSIGRSNTPDTFHTDISYQSQQLYSGAYSAIISSGNSNTF